MVRLQPGAIGPQVARLLEGLGCAQINPLHPVIGDQKFLQVIVVRILKDLVIDRFAPVFHERMMQNAEIVTPLAGVNHVPQNEPERQADQKLRLDGVKRQRCLGRQRGPAQGRHFQECVLDVRGSLRRGPG